MKHRDEDKEFRTADPNSPIWDRTHSTEEEEDRFVRSGNDIYNASLKHVVDEHARWVATNGREGTRLDLSDADLTAANLENTKLDYASMWGASFKKTKMAQVDDDGNLDRFVLQDLLNARNNPSDRLVSKARRTFNATKTGPGAHER